MTTLFSKIKLCIYIIGTLLVLPFFFLWISHAADDLLWEAFSQTEYNDTTIDVGKNVQTVWTKVIKWSFEVWTDGIWKSPSIIIKVTRLILILTIALSITMILYNGMIYIIETWQWKEWKSLIKNVWLIVVWILVSLFSVVIINLIQSIPATIEEWLVGNKPDNGVIKWKKMSFREFFKGIKKDDTEKLYTINVTYKDENGKTISKTGNKYKSWDSFYFTNPTITWYTISWTDTAIQGTVTGKNLTFTVIYITDDINVDDEGYDETLKEIKDHFKKLGLYPFTWKVHWVETRFVTLKNWQTVKMLEAYYYWLE